MISIRFVQLNGNVLEPVLVNPSQTLDQIYKTIETVSEHDELHFYLIGTADELRKTDSLDTLHLDCSNGLIIHVLISPQKTKIAIWPKQTKFAYLDFKSIQLLSRDEINAMLFAYNFVVSSKSCEIVLTVTSEKEQTCTISFHEYKHPRQFTLKIPIGESTHVFKEVNKGVYARSTALVTIITHSPFVHDPVIMSREVLAHAAMIANTVPSYALQPLKNVETNVSEEEFRTLCQQFMGEELILRDINYWPSVSCSEAFMRGYANHPTIRSLTIDYSQSRIPSAYRFDGKTFIDSFPCLEKVNLFVDVSCDVMFQQSIQDCMPKGKTSGFRLRSFLPTTIDQWLMDTLVSRFSTLETFELSNVKMTSQDVLQLTRGFRIDVLHLRKLVLHNTQLRTTDIYHLTTTFVDKKADSVNELHISGDKQLFYKKGARLLANMVQITPNLTKIVVNSECFSIVNMSAEKRLLPLEVCSA